jgi:hypothetical protein
VGGKAIDPERVLVAEQWHDLVDPAPHVCLAHPQLDLLIEESEHRQGIGHPPIDADQRDGAAAADDLDRQVKGAEPVDSRLFHQPLRHPVG